MLTKAERTKQFIIETAAPIYNQKGLYGANIDDVLDASKLTKGALYGHFKNKDDLTLQVIEYMLKNYLQMIESTIAQTKTAKEKVFAYLDLFKDPLNTYFQGGCPIFNIAVEADDNYPKLKESIADIIRAGQKKFVDILETGILNGEISNQIDAKIFAFKCVAAIEGGIVMCRAINEIQPMQGLIKSLKTEFENFVIQSSINK